MDFSEVDLKTKIEVLLIAIVIGIIDMAGKALGIFLISVYLYEILSPKWVTLSPERQFLKLACLVFFIWNHSMFDWKLGQKILKRWRDSSQEGKNGN